MNGQTVNGAEQPIPNSGDVRGFQGISRPDIDSGNSAVQSKLISPTADAYGRIQYAFDYFSEGLFDGQLPSCLLTFTRRKGTLGYFGAEFFASRDGETAHEISLNSSYFAARSDRETLSTLVHEQAHLWRFQFGGPNRRGGKGARGYHDKSWAAKMLDVGLCPTDDGSWAGKMTGYRMTHLIVDGGPFDRACRALQDSGFEIRWHDRRVVKTAAALPDDVDDVAGPRPTRSKFTCPGCGQNAYAKHSAKLICGVCNNRPLIGERR